MIVVFDGVCNLCNGWVQFIFKRDRTEEIQFAPIQSPAGQVLLSRYGYTVRGLDTLLVVEHGVLYVKTEAIRHVLARLGGVWRWVAVALRLAPVPARDWIYTQIAINRYSLFGRRAACVIPYGPLAVRFLVRPESAESSYIE